MLAPKRVKRRKTHKGRMRGKAHRGSKVSFGDYGLQALEPTWITNRQIEDLILSKLVTLEQVRAAGLQA